MAFARLIFQSLKAGTRRLAPCARATSGEMNVEFAPCLAQHLDLQSQARALLGDRAFSLLVSYGRLMSGRHTGRYVSGLPAIEQLKLAQRLTDGDEVPVHLMHRHLSGNYESSSLRLLNGKLIMVFRDREEVA